MRTLPWYRRIRHLAVVLAVAVVLPLVVVPASPAAAGPSFFILRSMFNGKCVTPGYNGTPVTMGDCWIGWHQQWLWSGDQFVNRESGRCLEILNSEIPPGGYAGIWDCWGGPNQRWSWGNPLGSGAREIRSPLNNLCLGVSDDHPPYNDYVRMWNCWGGAATAWVAVPA